VKAGFHLNLSRGVNSVRKKRRKQQRIIKSRQFVRTQWLIHTALHFIKLALSSIKQYQRNLHVCLLNDVEQTVVVQ